MLHVASTSPVRDHDLHAWLDATERDRRRALRRAEDRDRFATSRALLKTLVASVARVAADEVRLTYACAWCDRPHGRPAVAGPDAAAGLQVSISHSGSRVVAAATTAGPVGVDVEQTGLASFRGFADLVLTASEATCVDAAPAAQRDRARATYWVRKEAVLKATGYGLSIPATSVEVTPPTSPPAVTAWSSGHELPAPAQLWDLDVGRHHVGCVAVLSLEAPSPRMSADVSIARYP
jgi:4'-phosphopantetheinyl transferase